MNHKQLMVLSCMNLFAITNKDDNLIDQMRERANAQWGSEEAFNKLVEALPNIDDATITALFLEIYDQVVAGGPVLFEDMPEWRGA